MTRFNISEPHAIKNEFRTNNRRLISASFGTIPRSSLEDLTTLIFKFYPEVSYPPINQKSAIQIPLETNLLPSISTLEQRGFKFDDSDLVDFQ